MSYAVERSDGDEHLLVVVNAGRARETVSLTCCGGAKRLWGDGELTNGDNQTSISMAPRSAAIWKLDD